MAAAKAEYDRFFAVYGRPEEKHDWSRVKLYKKSEYLAKAFDALSQADAVLLTQHVRPYLHQFLHGGPTIWQLLLEQDARRISYRFGPQDHPAVMQVAVPLAVTLSALTGHAAAHLWQSEDLVALVQRQFATAVACLSPAGRETAA